jgi:hypothetical protein
VRAVAIIAVVAACGRIGFGPIPGGDAGDDGGGEGTANGPQLIHVAATYTIGGAQVIDFVYPYRAGDLAVVGIDIYSAMSGIATLSDDAGNTYVSADVLSVTGGSPGQARAAAIWYATNTQPGAATSIQVTAVFSGTTAGGAMWVAEFSGLDTASPLDTGAVAMLPAGATAMAPPVVTTQPNELVFSIVDLDNTAAITGLGASPFASLSLVNRDAAAYYIAPVPGSYGAVWNESPTDLGCASTVAFKPAM